MSRSVTLAVIKSGLVSKDTLQELNHWGLPIEMVEATEVLDTPEAIVGRIQEALEGEDLVKIRDTDLDVLRCYLTSQKQGMLRIAGDDEAANIEVSYCVTPMGEYVIPWRSESIREYMTDPRTYLKVDGSKIGFSDVRELFFGEHKAFMVCTPAVVSTGKKEGTNGSA